MEIKFEEGKWLARKNKKAKTVEDVTHLVKIDGDFMSVMGKAGRTNFHSYLGKSGNKWLEMHGVTSLLNYWGEKDRLVQWAVDRAVDYIFEKSDEFKDGEFFKGSYVDEKVLQEARSAHKRSLEDAGAHGTDTHAILELYINHSLEFHDGEAKNTEWYLNKDSQEYAFAEWAVKNEVRFKASELPLRSVNLWCAGTCDGVIEFGGKRYILDFKTSNYVSFKQFIQCGAYALMHEEMGKGKIDGILIVHIPRTGGFKVYEELAVDKYKKYFEAIVMLVKGDKNKSAELYS